MSTTRRTRKLAYVAMLTALSFLLMYIQFPLIPGADFLKIDFSILPILVALLLFNLKASLIILLLRSLLTLLLNNAGPSTLIGIPMNIIALGLFTVAFSILWVKSQHLKTFVVAALTGTGLLTLAMLALNYFYAVPMYASFANFDINQYIGMTKYLYGMVLPFNLLQGLIWSLAFYLLQLSIKPLLKNIQ